MPTQRLTIPAGWPASPNFTASGTKLSVFVRNTNRAPADRIYWAVTSGDIAPSFSPQLGHEIAPAASSGVTLEDGERLWLAAAGDALTATVTDGAVT